MELLHSAQGLAKLPRLDGVIDELFDDPEDELLQR
jgi:hypothetical protein